MEDFWGSAIKFVPSDEHIVKMVQERALGRQLPAVLFNGIRIRDVDVFGDLNPEEIYAQSEPFHQKERYCFTLMKRKGKSGQRFVRTTGGGTWKLQCTTRIKDKVTRQPVAIRNYLSYKPAGANDVQDCKWGLYVYSLVSPSPAQYQDYAVCKILRTRESRKLERDVDVQDEQCKLPTMDCTSVPCDDTFDVEYNDSLGCSFEDLGCEEIQGLTYNFFSMDEHGCPTLDFVESTTTCKDHQERQHSFIFNNDENEARDVTYEDLFDTNNSN